MSIAYSIVDAKLWHCGAMSRKLCAGRWLAYKAAGIDAKAQLRGLWAASIVRRSCLIDGRLVAIWGLTGTILARTGHVWLVIAPEAAEHPRELVREVRAQIAEFSRDRTLRATVAMQDGTALRFARFLGFIEDDDEEQVEKARKFSESGLSVVQMVLRAGG